MIRLFFLDTCALVKRVIGEPGHELLMWLLNDPEAVLGHPVHAMANVHVRDEFPRTVVKMEPMLHAIAGPNGTQKRTFVTR